jgi:DNA-binding HxlR family transcriptional regulator
MNDRKPKSQIESNKNCPLAAAMSVLGEGWTLLVLREAFLGTRQFKDFERELGIARNILSNRLRKLVDQGLLHRVPAQNDRRVVEYRLTDASRALLPSLVALSQWAGEWLCQPKHPVRFIDSASETEVAPVRVCNQQGEALEPHQLRMAANSETASAAMLERYQSLERPRKTKR